MMKKSIMSVRGEHVEPHSENMGEALWREKETLALAWLEEALPTLKGSLTSDAWLGGWGLSDEMFLQSCGLSPLTLTHINLFST
jgi:hypothetical protein